MGDLIWGRAGFSVCCLLTMTMLGQGATLLRLEQTRKNGGNEQWFGKQRENLRREKAERDAFIARFVNEPPQERVRLWCRGMHESLVGDRMTQLMIARGIDTTPYLAEIVRTGKSCDRFQALKLLCKMDRFVPAAQFLIPDGEEHFQPKAEGRGNRFMVVDGRRIGPEAFAVVKWATEQTRDKDLRFHAQGIYWAVGPGPAETASERSVRTMA